MPGRRPSEWYPINRLRGEVDRLFNEFFEEGSRLTPPWWFGARAYPAVNLWEDAESLHAEFELPGFRMEDIDLQVVGNELTIGGRRGGEEREGTAFHRRERGTGEFKRMIRLPADINPDQVDAKLRDGVLLVRLGKAEAAKPKKIQVKAIGK